MSRFLSAKHKSLVPYPVGGLEGGNGRQYVKLNRNELPFPPSPKAVSRVSEAAMRMHLYPNTQELAERIAELYGIDSDEVLITSGTDEALNLVMVAFCDRYHPVAFPTVSYELYPVIADLNGIPYKHIPLNEDFSVNPDEYIGLGRTIFLENPNSMTGLPISCADIDDIVRRNADNVVIIDESKAGLEFQIAPESGLETAVSLIRDYENLLVTQTFLSLTGERIGFVLGNPDLIHDLCTIRDAFNPHNVSTQAIAAGLGTLDDEEYMRSCCRRIIDIRNFTANELLDLGFTFPNSVANFLLARHPRVDGKAMYAALKQHDVLVHHANKMPILAQYNRITIGSRENMELLLDALRDILGE